MWCLWVAFLVACGLTGVTGDGLSQEMQYLWDLVVLQQQSRNIPQGDSSPIRRACQFGLSEGSMELAQWLLMVPDRPLEVLRGLFDHAKIRGFAAEQLLVVHFFPRQNLTDLT